MLYQHRALLLILLMPFFITACNTGIPPKPQPAQEIVKTDEQHAQQSTKSTVDNIWQRIHQGYGLNSYVIPTIGKQRIESILTRYRRHPEDIANQLQASTPYLFYIVEQLEKNHLPLELALLPLVESRYDPFAFSSGRASGLWQFIPGTGKRFGLHENWWLDERRDIVESTQAAIKYFKILNNHFEGNWLHTIAAYNAGEGTILRAIKQNKHASKPTDYWSLPIPKETRFYIPKLLAWADIIVNHKAYNIRLPTITSKPYFSVVDVGSQIDFSHLAEISQLSIKEIYQLNPAYHRWATDPSPPHRLLFPVDIADKVIQALDQYPVDKRIRWQRYRIKSGDSLSEISKKFGVSKAVIKSINHLETDVIRTGKTLLIPQAQKGQNFYAKRPDEILATRYAKHKERKIVYSVRNGDSLYSIAKRFRVTINNIKRWNNLKRQKYIQPGQKLKLYISLTDQARVF